MKPWEEPTSRAHLRSQPRQELSDVGSTLPGEPGYDQRPMLPEQRCQVRHAPGVPVGGVTGEDLLDQVHVVTHGSTQLPATNAEHVPREHPEDLTQGYIQLVSVQGTVLGAAGVAFTNLPRVHP